MILEQSRRTIFLYTEMLSFLYRHSLRRGTCENVFDVRLAVLKMKRPIMWWNRLEIYHFFFSFYFLMNRDFFAVSWIFIALRFLFVIVTCDTWHDMLLPKMFNLSAQIWVKVQLKLPSIDIDEEIKSKAILCC